MPTSQPHSPQTLVLIVDDDEDVRESLMLLLIDDDYSVANACNGAEACSALDADLEPNVILLDMMMPVMSGFDFLRWKATSRHAQIPVVIFTASVQRVGPPFTDIPSLSKTASIAEIIAALEHAMSRNA